MIRSVFLGTVSFEQTFFAKWTVEQKRHKTQNDDRHETVFAGTVCRVCVCVSRMNAKASHVATIIDELVIASAPSFCPTNQMSFARLCHKKCLFLATASLGELTPPFACLVP